MTPSMNNAGQKVLYDRWAKQQQALSKKFYGMDVNQATAMTPAKETANGLMSGRITPGQLRRPMNEDPVSALRPATGLPRAPRLEDSIRQEPPFNRAMVMQYQEPTPRYTDMRGNAVTRPSMAQVTVSPDGVPTLSLKSMDSIAAKDGDRAAIQRVQHRKNITNARKMGDIEGFRDMSPSELENAIAARTDANALALGERKKAARESLYDRREALKAARSMAAIERIQNGGAPKLPSVLPGSQAEQADMAAAAVPQVDPNSALGRLMIATGRMPKPQGSEDVTFNRDPETGEVQTRPPQEVDAILSQAEGKGLLAPGKTKELDAWLRSNDVTPAEVREWYRDRESLSWGPWDGLRDSLWGRAEAEDRFRRMEQVRPLLGGGMAASGGEGARSEETMPWPDDGPVPFSGEPTFRDRIRKLGISDGVGSSASEHAGNIRDLMRGAFNTLQGNPDGLGPLTARPLQRPIQYGDDPMRRNAVLRYDDPRTSGVPRLEELLSNAQTRRTMDYRYDDPAVQMFQELQKRLGNRMIQPLTNRLA